MAIIWIGDGGVYLGCPYPLRLEVWSLIAPRSGWRNVAVPLLVEGEDRFPGNQTRTVADARLQSYRRRECCLGSACASAPWSLVLENWMI